MNYKNMSKEELIKELKSKDEKLNELKKIKNKHKKKAKKYITNIKNLLHGNELENKTLNNIIDVMPVSLIVLDSNGDIKLINKKTKNIFGNILNNNIYELKDNYYNIYSLDGSLYPKDKLPLLRSLNNKEYIKNEKVLIKFNNGNEYFISVYCNPIIDSKGNIKGAVSAFQDITMKKKAKEKLKHGKQMNDIILSAIKETLLIVDDKGKILTINETGAKKLGKKSKELKGKYINDFIKFDDNIFLKYKIKDLKTKKIPIHFKGKCKERTLDTSIYPYINSNNDVKKLVVFSKDITKKIQCELALKESEERFRKIFKQAYIGISILSKKGTILDSNDTVSKITGYSKKELLEKSFKDITHSDGVYKENKYLEELLMKKRQCFHIEKKCIHKKGHIVWLNLHCSVINNEKGNPSYIIAAIQDISKLKNYNLKLKNLSNKYKSSLKLIKEKHDELIIANHTKSNFIANISHELKTPLNIIMTYLEYILEEEEGKLNLEQKSLLATAYKNTERLKVMIDDMLDLSTLESGKMKLNYKNVNLNTLLNKIVKEKKLTVKNKDLKIIFNDYSDEIHLYTDPIRLRQVIDNVLDNSIKFTDEGYIDISINLTKTSISISVIDQGIGIDNEKQENIFKPFYQADNSFFKRYKGVGLGLSISKKIINLLNGDIMITNNKCKGCTTKITLPLNT
ncbi:MAG: PAS domain S-box protein [Firmicutes bacterium]|nr:PAS domain S-box protein [Bacillota bacterium]